MQPSFDPGGDTFDDAFDGGNPTYTVGELVEAINATLSRRFSDGIWVRGEIDGLRHSGPHTYFSLVDDDHGDRAVVPVQLFAPTKRRLTPLLKKNRLRLGNGMKVRINGHLDYYGPGGRLGLKMAGLDPTFTLGQLSQARDQVVRRLVAAGLFDANRSRPMPPVPLNVGVVTSVGTAAWHDFHDELARSGVGFRLLVADVRVQGPTAIEMVTAAIRSLSRAEPDVIVVIRGGGARTELAVFDAESIAGAIATSRVPVITGLGHETDRSIADEVAHTALKTPTAVARRLVDTAEQFRESAEQCFAAILHRAERELATGEQRIDRLATPIERQTRRAVDRATHRLSERQTRLTTAVDRALLDGDRRLYNSARRLRGAAPRRVVDAERALDLLAARIDGVDPERLMQRGWSITRRADTGATVRSVADLETGASLITQLRDGSITSTVDATDHHRTGPDDDQH